MPTITVPPLTEITPLLQARADEAERLCTLPHDLVDTLRWAGLFRLATPRQLGGAELPPADIVRTVAECSRADGSAGWTITIGNATAFLAWLDPAVAADLLGSGWDAIGASVFAPTGRLTPSDDGAFRLSGTWSFSSGCRHTDWFLNGAFVFDGDTPRVLAGRGPDWRLAVFPASAATVVDNWDVLGLRGTGSHDVVADAITVPAEHTITPFHQPARHDGPLWRLPFFTLVGVFLAGIPLGIGRRALDEFAELATTKVRPPAMTPIAAEADLQVALARAEGGLQAASAFVYDTLGALWETACAGDVPDAPQRVRFLLANQQAMRAALDAVDTAFTFGGAGAARAGHPLQRCFRDLHTAAQHIYFSSASAKRYAMNRLSIDQPEFWF